MAKFVQFKVWKDGKEALPLVLTFSNMKKADEFDTWCIINRRKFERHGPYKLFTSADMAVDELAIWER